MKRLRATVLFTLATAVAATPLGASAASAGVTTAPAAPTTALQAAFKRSAGCPAPGGVSIARAGSPNAEIVFSGHGWGHGLGMSQYGAQGAAKLGCTYRDILGTYYTGSKIVTKSMASPVRLALKSGASRATLEAENGAVTWSTGVTQPKGSIWRVNRKGNDLVLVDAAGKTRSTVKAGTVLSVSHSGTVIRVRSFSGSSTSAASDLRTKWDVTRFVGSSSGIEVTQQITGSGGRTAIQKYLLGLAEVPISWPQHALRAQVVAARTYLVSKYDSTQKVYTLKTTTADQVYRGWPQELADQRLGNWAKAVDATAGQVLVDSAGKTITAMYSSSMGGHTEDRQYVYGSYGISYLKAVDDSRWDKASDNPYRAWAVGKSRKQIASTLGFTSVTKVAVAARGKSARLSGVKVTGVKGGKTVTTTYTGSTFRSKFGLRSPGFVVLTGTTAPAPAPTPAPTPAPEPNTPLEEAPDKGPEPAPAPPAAEVQALAGDWNGDGRTDVGTYDNGLVTLWTAGKVTTFRFGSRGDRVVVGDWDGDGVDGLAVVRGGTWHLRDTLSTGPGERSISYGRLGDIPVAGRFTAGKADGIGVIRDGMWHLRFTATSGVGERSYPWKIGAAMPLIGDWDGDGVDDPGRRTGNVFELRIAGGAATGTVAEPVVYASPAFGSASDLPLAGDFDGDGKATPAVARGTTFHWRNDLKGGVGTATASLGR